MAIRLTPRQTEVIELLLGGNQNIEIARQMRISPQTLKDHLRALAQKFLIDTSRFSLRVALVSRIHDSRALYGVRCPTCDN